MPNPNPNPNPNRRCIIMEDRMRLVRIDINTHEQDPTSIHRIRDQIAQISKAPSH